MTCLVRMAALNWPDAMALQDGDRSISYSDYDHLIVDMARRLKRLGVIPGNRVAILARNSVEFATLIFAIARLGASAVLLNPRHSSRDWSSILNQCNSKVLIIDGEFQSQLKDVVVPTWVVEEGYPDSISRVVPVNDDIAREIDTEQETTVVFSSGSSGQPKGVILTYVNHYFSAVGSNENIRLTADDTWLLSLPLCHVGGVSILFRSALAGTTAYLMRRFDPVEANALINSGTVTHLSLVPTMLVELLRERQHRPLPPTLEAILLGGAPIPARLIEKARELNLPLLTSYGLSEAASQVCTLSPTDSPDRLDTSGRPLKYRELVILNDDEMLTPNGSVGEIAVRGEVLFAGYLDGRRPLDADGWFHTGDLGRLDARGYLIVLGRKDDMLVSGGENIYPREIELVAECFPGVEECIVIGVPDEKWGQRPVLFVVVASPAEFDTESLRQHLQGQLARMTVPKTIITVGALPQLGIGKVDKIQLLDMYHRSRSQGAD